jgi:cell wall-associated NlpC family hydrolase/LysM repeat protein
MRIIAVLPWLVAIALAQSTLTHTVQRGDTLFAIASRNHTTVEILMRLNNLSDATLSVGQVLQLPPRVVEHTVQRGDTLFSVARRYGSTVQAIQQENRLEGTKLSLGQVLRVPQVRVTAPNTPAPAPASASPTPPAGAAANLTGATPLPSLIPPQPAQGQPLQPAQGQPLQPAQGQPLQPAQGQPLQPAQGQPSQPAPEPPQPAPEPAPEPPSSGPPNQPSDTDYDPTHPLIQVVLRYLGLPYVFGANSDRAVDCSAFVQQVFADLGIRVPRTSREQWAAFPTVQGAMRKGDLVFFSFGGRQIDHVGIYLGRGVFAHANSHGSRVVIESLDSPFFRRVYRGAKRVEALQAVRP